MSTPTRVTTRTNSHDPRHTNHQSGTICPNSGRRAREQVNTRSAPANLATTEEDAMHLTKPC